MGVHRTCQFAVTVLTPATTRDSSFTTASITNNIQFANELGKQNRPFYLFDFRKSAAISSCISGKDSSMESCILFIAAKCDEPKKAFSRCFEDLHCA